MALTSSTNACIDFRNKEWNVFIFYINGTNLKYTIYYVEWKINKSKILSTNHKSQDEILPK